MSTVGRVIVAVCASLIVLPLPAAALERICDAAYEDCRAPLLTLIHNETVAIDIGYWFMEDARYSAAIELAVRRGVRVRIVFDTEGLAGHPSRLFVANQFRSAGIPMIEKVSPGITHWKMMLFVGQNTVQFSGANYTAEAFVHQAPYSDYVDEVIYFTDRPTIVNSFKRAYDDVWVDTASYSNYANVTSRQRAYPLHPIDPEMQFYIGFRERSVARYNAETLAIDAIIYRITDRAHTDALIAAVRRGVRIRLISEPLQYEDPTRLWHRWNIDRLYMAGLAHPIGGQPGIQIRHRAHLGLTHEKLTILQGQRMVIFGSSNWTSASTDSQLEHNMFTTNGNFYAWSRDHFERKWNNLGPSPETQPFTPRGPAAPLLSSPANGATGQAVTGTLRWNGGYWAHKYDVYLGTNPNSLVRILDDAELGPEQQSFAITGLNGGTTYYWRVVGRTLANLSQTSATWSFTTAGSPGSGNSPPVVALTAPASGASYAASASIAIAANAQDADGTVTRVDFYAGATLIGSDTSSPWSITWTGVAAGSYTLTARAIDNRGATATSSAVIVTVGSGSPGPGTPLPGPWAQQDIGSVGAPGDASVSGATWTVAGSGTDIWGTADELRYVYQPMTGDGSIVARVTSVQHADQWTKAGVMIRAALTPGAMHAFMLVTPTTVKGLAFQRRTATNGMSTSTSGGSDTAPRWVKLTRSGSTVTAYHSANGVAWTAVGSDTVPMPATVMVGLAVTSHRNGVVARATFDNVAITPAGSGPSNAPPVVTITAPAPGATFTAPATIAIAATASDSNGTIARVDFLAGATLLTSDTSAPYSVTWSNVAAGTYTLTARATDNSGLSTTSVPVTVTVNSAATGPGPSGPSLPAPWAQQDVGAVLATGDTSVSGGTWTIRGSGADIWYGADGFRYVSRPMSGDGAIVARVTSLDQTHVWSKAGVMMRESLSAGARHASMLVSGAKGLAFQSRASASGVSTHVPGSSGGAPAWVRLERSGHTFSAYSSSNGSSWTLVGTQSITMGSTIYVGLAVTSHNDGVLARAVFDNVTFTPGGGTTPGGTSPSGQPSPWANGDIGLVGAAGSATVTGGLWTVRGAGADIWEGADGFQFVHRTLTGDGTIVARVDSLQHVHRWTKAGVMMRAALTPGSRHAMLIVSPGNGTAFQRRVTDAAASVHTPGSAGTAPVWVRLQRSGSTFTASTSSNGSSWTVVGSETIAMPATIYVGLPVTSHTAGTLATATFSNVSVTP